MKKFMFVMALAMIFFAVEGYAQRNNSSSSRSTRTATVTRTTTSRSVTTPTRSKTTTSRNSRPVEMPQVRPQNTGRRPVEMPQVRPQNTGRRPVEMPKIDGRGGSNHSRTTPPPRSHHHNGHKPHAPHFGHHHHYHHHHYHCVFTQWVWISYLGYSQRFIRHISYSDRYFDSHLGYYVYGDLSAPQRIEICGVSFYRHGECLMVNGADNAGYYLYADRHVVYEIGRNTVEITTGNGYATLYICDGYENYATYYL
ncbi:MAG: hypothetical protein E7004_07100 [Alphaproteobacteria bacterium]|nr:hypothetical protein [Alphaproteobacteria bacterium]